MEKKYFLRAGVFLAIPGLWAIYILCLKEIPLQEPFATWTAPDYWVTYLRETCWMTVMALLLAMAGRARTKGRKKAVFLFWLVCALLFGFLTPVFTTKAFLWKWKKLLFSLWPFMVYVLADSIKRRSGKLQKTAAGVACYYGAVLAGIWIIEDVLVFSEFYRREILEMVYLLIVAVAAWEMVKTREKVFPFKTVSFMAGWDERKIEKIAPVLVLIVLFIGHQRIYEILSSLTGSEVSGVGANWLKYRFALLSTAWHGDFSIMEELYVAWLSCDCPLFWIHYLKGPVNTIVILALEALLLYCLFMLAKQQKETLPQVLLTALIILAVLGLPAELFLIATPNVGLLLLRNPGDVIVVLYLALNEWKQVGQLQESV